MPVEGSMWFQRYTTFYCVKKNMRYCIVVLYWPTGSKCVYYISTQTIDKHAAWLDVGCHHRSTRIPKLGERTEMCFDPCKVRQTKKIIILGTERFNKRIRNAKTATTAKQATKRGLVSKVGIEWPSRLRLTFDHGHKWRSWCRWVFSQGLPRRSDMLPTWLQQRLRQR
jgi:hypothetical protein